MEHLQAETLFSFLPQVFQQIKINLTLRKMEKLRKINKKLFLRFTTNTYSLKKSTFLLLIIALYSCNASRGKTVLYTDISQYSNSLGPKNFYIVDTINIENPVIVITRNDHAFILSKEELANYDGKEDFFYKNENIFIYGSEIPFGLPSEFYLNSLIKTNCEEYLERNKNMKYKNIQDVREFKKNPVFFLFILVRADYYHQLYTGFHTHARYKLKYDKFSYYKVATPCCS